MLVLALKVCVIATGLCSQHIQAGFTTTTPTSDNASAMEICRTHKSALDVAIEKSKDPRFKTTADCDYNDSTPTKPILARMVMTVSKPDGSAVSGPVAYYYTPEMVPYCEAFIKGYGPSLNEAAAIAGVTHKTECRLPAPRPRPL